MGSLARAARKSNQAFLQAGLRYAELTRAQAPGSANVQDLDAKQHEAEVRWRLARKIVHIAFGNSASASYRMMHEPVIRQTNVPTFNNLLVQKHDLASPIHSAMPLLAGMVDGPEDSENGR